MRTNRMGRYGTPDGGSITFQEHGSLVRILPVGDYAKEWLDMHLSHAPQWGGYVVEGRYVLAIARGMHEDGIINLPEGLLEDE